MAIAKQEFTNAGRSMLGRAQAGETLTVTGIVVGSGAAAAPSDLWPLTALISLEMSIAISTKRDYGQGTLLVEGSFLSSAAPHSFELREIGVLAHIGAEADRLYSVSNVLADDPDLIDPDSPSVQAFKIKLIIDRIPADNIIIQIGPSENVVGENIGSDTVGPGVYKSAAGNLLSFKRLVQGVGMKLTDGVDTVTVATNQLEIDLDLYVPETNPEAPSPDVAFHTIQAALDYTLQWYIPQNHVVRIHVQGIELTISASISVTHPQMEQIQILGAAPLETAIVSTTNHDTTQIDVVVDSIAGLAVGDYVVIIAGSDWRWNGARNITDIKPGNIVTLKKLFAGGVGWTGSATGGALRKYPTRIRSTSSAPYTQAFATGSGRLGLIQNMTLVGYGTHTNRSAIEPGANNIRGIVAANWGVGIWCSNSTLNNLASVYCCDNDYGLVADSSAQVLSIGDVYLNGNSIYGAWVRSSQLTLGAQTDLSACMAVIIGNGQIGLLADYGGVILANNCFSGVNPLAHKALNQGFLFGGVNTSYPFHTGSNTLDGYAGERGFLKVQRNGGTYATTSPVSGSVGNFEGFVHVT
jgi:hypothetical protein